MKCNNVFLFLVPPRTVKAGGDGASSAGNVGLIDPLEPLLDADPTLSSEPPPEDLICSVCKVKFAVKFSLLRHARKFHPEMDLSEIADNKVNCQGCEKEISKPNMAKHKKVCTGKKVETKKKQVHEPVHPLGVMIKLTKEELLKEVCQEFHAFMKSQRNLSKKTRDTYTWKVYRFLETKSFDVLVKIFDPKEDFVLGGEEAYMENIRPGSALLLHFLCGMAMVSL